ncbi:acyl carrier protein [Variovorax sp. N23]|uniref:acyl carrier protein n=1 Tax=Variovorax sp. N23 TaxID=2980555 RepID=UPI0021C7BE56|nr:acyl carrier protein [Variovorax sp. N23]MCU4120424.1 acyl carrier protein [Variovorax sp. N23]
MSSTELHQMSKDVASDWIVAYLADCLKIEPSRIEAHVVLSEYGLDSMQAVMMSGDISELTGREVPPNILYEYPTVDQLAAYMEKLSGTDLKSLYAEAENWKFDVRNL